jgi:organic hydroperoxide reductase OsmC/OhrA
MSLIPLSYKTSYQWSGDGESGQASAEGLPALSLGSPLSHDSYSPEHLLVLAAEACLANFVLVLARMSKFKVKTYRSTAEGVLIQEGMVEFRFSKVIIRPEIRVEAGQEEQACRLLDKAHELCLIARSLRCPVELEPMILVD